MAFLPVVRQAIRIADGASHVLYDSCASVYEKQNRLKDALRDAKKTTDIAPAQCQGYFLCSLIRLPQQTLRGTGMCSLAFDRFGDDAKHKGCQRELVAMMASCSHLEAQTKSQLRGCPSNYS